MKINDYARRYDVLMSEAPLFEIPHRKEFILKEIGRGKRVLDLGCLGGQISKLIKDQNNEVYGVEINAKAAQVASTRGIRVKVFDLNDGIPFEDSFFDAVNAGEIVDHIYDTKFLFDEINRVLKPQGILVFSAVNLNSLTNRLRVFGGGYLSGFGAFPDDHNGRRIRVFNIQKIREICSHTGFQIQRISAAPKSASESLGSRFSRPLAKLVPGLGELLLVRAIRRD